MMDWAITLGLMLCVLVGGAMSVAQAGGLFKKDTVEPLKSQHTMQIGMAWMLASVIPFWRGHHVLGMISFLVGLVTLLQGCVAMYDYAKQQARASRLEELAANDPVLAPLDTSEPMLTGKAASKRRRATRRASMAAANEASMAGPTPPDSPSAPN